MESFDKYAESYSLDLDKVLSKNIGGDSSYFSEYKIRVLKNIIENRDLSPKRVLDFGCGIGKNTRLIKKILQHTEVIGIDISEKSLDQARKYSQQEIKYLQMLNNDRLPLESCTFDIIFISNVFHHIKFDLHSKIVDELYRVLKKGGLLIMFEHNTLNPITRKIVSECEFDRDAKLLNYAYSKNLFKKAGFSYVSCRFILFIPPFLRKISCIDKMLWFVPLGGQYYIESYK